MAHNIQLRDIQTGNEMAWHKLTKVEKDITAQNCGIYYGMEMRDLYFSNGKDLVLGNGRQIVSLDDGLPVGRAVGKDYQLIANVEIWDTVKNALEGTKHSVVSCGTVANRSLGFVSVKVSDDFIAAGRNTQSVMNVIWGHGGNKSVIGRSGFTVVVCENTLNMAMAEKSDFKLSIRHTAKANVLDLGRAIEAHIGVEAEFKLAMNHLHAIDATPSVARKIYAGFVSGGVTPETKTGISRFNNTVNRMAELFQYGKGNSGRTMADVLNGATDYYSHESSGGAENPWKQFSSSEFGSGNARKTEFAGLLSDSVQRLETVRHGESVLLALGE